MTHASRVLFILTIFPALMVGQDTSACENRALLANVVDVRGQQIGQLTSAQFRASIQGQPIKVVSARFETQPKRILILLDVSGSMWADPEQWQLVKLIAGDVVSSGPPQADFALATFSNKFETNVKFRQGRDAVRRSIASLDPSLRGAPKSSGETALDDAILQAASLFGNAQAGDALYAITDGLDNESSSSTSKVIQYLGQRDLRLFASVVHNARFVPMSSGPRSDGAELVGNIVKETGGYHVALETDQPAKAFGKAQNALRQLYDLMASFYLLDLDLPKELDKPRELKLTVVDSNGNKQKGTIFYRQKVFPCATPK